MITQLQAAYERTIDVAIMHHIASTSDQTIPASDNPRWWRYRDLVRRSRRLLDAIQRRQRVNIARERLPLRG